MYYIVMNKETEQFERNKDNSIYFIENKEDNICKEGILYEIEVDFEFILDLSYVCADGSHMLHYLNEDIQDELKDSIKKYEMNKYDFSKKILFDDGFIIVKKVDFKEKEKTATILCSYYETFKGEDYIVYTELYIKFKTDNTEDIYTKLDNIIEEGEFESY